MAINGKTRLIGLLGWPVSHSFSPAIHNAAAEALGLNWIYVPLPVQTQDLPAALAGLPALGFQGVNVTVPHKQTVMPFLDKIEPAAQIIGAVNTILIKRMTNIEGRKWTITGSNTDWVGFLADLKALKVHIKHRDCLVLGAGGSARAVVYALVQAGAHAHVLARRPAQAEQMALDFGDMGAVHPGSLEDLEKCAADLTAPLIVNSTPLGMTPHTERSVWPENLPFPRDSFAYDLVYNPKQTLFMQQAVKNGCRSRNGLGMLIQQGALAFEAWTNQKPDIEVMGKALDMALTELQGNPS